MSECNHLPAPKREHSARDLAFYDFLASKSVQGAAKLPFAVGAFYGYMLREHVDACHPGEVDLALDKALPLVPEERREGYAAGYRFADTWQPDAEGKATP